MGAGHAERMEQRYPAHELCGYPLVAPDGIIGRVHDLYIDDRRWLVRYLVVELRHGLTARRVLVSPVCVRAVDTMSARIEVSLSREQVRHSPDMDADRPVSRQHEIALHEYYGIPFYWTDEPLEGERTPDPHLRAAGAVRGYTVIGRDAGVGHVDDFLIDVAAWSVTHVVVARRHWLSGPRRSVPVRAIERISWVGKAVYLHAAALDRVDQPA